jgi:hypothetical protein
LVPTVVYNYVSDHEKFWIVTWFGLVGWILTIVFIPDTTGLDLREQERYWSFVREGREQDYHGIVIHPRHISLWERLVLRRHKHYNPELDRDAKLSELKERYEASLSSEQDVDDVPDHVTAFFEKQRPMSEETNREELPKLTEKQEQPQDFEKLEK